MRVVKDIQNNKESRGFGFLKFYDKDVRKTLINRDFEAFDRVIQCKCALNKYQSQSKTQDEKTRKIFVGGLSQAATSKHLRETFH